MGTNYYYYHRHACPECKRGFEAKHIGKSSHGWCFSLHIIPEENIISLIDWIALWNKEGSYIEDEYGNSITPMEMLEIITKREGNVNPTSSPPLGYPSWEKFHCSNYSQFGQNGLIRYQVKNGICVRHGEGTYDYCQGDYS